MFALSKFRSSNESTHFRSYCGFRFSLITVVIGTKIIFDVYHWLSWKIKSRKCVFVFFFGWEISVNMHIKGGNGT